MRGHKSQPLHHVPVNQVSVTREGRVCAALLVLPRRTVSGSATSINSEMGVLASCLVLIVALRDACRGSFGHQGPPHLDARCMCVIAQRVTFVPPRRIPFLSMYFVEFCIVYYSYTYTRYVMVVSLLRLGASVHFIGLSPWWSFLENGAII